MKKGSPIKLHHDLQSHICERSLKNIKYVFKYWRSFLCLIFVVHHWYVVGEFFRFTDTFFVNNYIFSTAFLKIDALVFIASMFFWMTFLVAIFYCFTGPIAVADFTNTVFQLIFHRSERKIEWNDIVFLCCFRFGFGKHPLSQTSEF